MPDRLHSIDAAPTALTAADLARKIREQVYGELYAIGIALGRPERAVHGTREELYAYHQTLAAWMLMHFREPNYLQAQEHLRTALSYTPDDDHVRSLLAMCCVELGQTEEARKVMGG